MIRAGSLTPRGQAISKVSHPSGESNGNFPYLIHHCLYYQQASELLTAAAMVAESAARARITALGLRRLTRSRLGS
jgi:hypothetical protein